MSSRPRYSNTVILRPTSPIPPSATMRSASDTSGGGELGPGVTRRGYLATVTVDPLACPSVDYAFSTGQAKTVGIFAIAVIVLAGVLLSFVFTKLTGRL